MENGTSKASPKIQRIPAVVEDQQGLDALRDAYRSSARNLSDENLAEEIRKGGSSLMQSFLINEEIARLLESRAKRKTVRVSRFIAPPPEIP